MNIPSILQPKITSIPFKQFFYLYREPTITYCITPNNAPSHHSYSYSSRRKLYHDDLEIDKDILANTFFNVLSGLYSKFYLPERIRFQDGIRLKLNDVVSYKILFQQGTIKFYLTVPEKWSKSFINAIKKDWGNVDIFETENELIHFDYKKAKAANIMLKHHHCLSIKFERNFDPLYPALSSLASTLTPNDKMLIDYNISPASNLWKQEAEKQLRKFKQGGIPRKKERSLRGLLNFSFDLLDVIMDEILGVIYDLLNIEYKENKENNEPRWELEYSHKKINAGSKGFKIQTRVIAESDDARKSKMIIKGAATAFSSLDGDNQFINHIIRTKTGVKAIIKAVQENKPQVIVDSDILFEKEMNQLVRLPNKQTLKEYKKVIEQDSHTRADIDENFLLDKNDAIPFATTIDKEPNVLHFGGYHREWWSEKGRYVKDKTKLDDRSTVTMLWGSQGSGKTSAIIRQACHTFGVDLPIDEWKERSKSVVLFDVADGEMISKIWNTVPERLRDRVIIMNHSDYHNPIPVNFSELEEFNRKVMKDDDYAYKMAEMESFLVRDILQAEKSIYVDRWFTTALQVAHIADPDWGYAEAIRLLTDDDFRINEVIPKISNERILLELEIYNEMRYTNKTDPIIQTIQNRFVQLERDQKLWDCIAQKPLRKKNGDVAINFRKWMDGDENGAYMVLVYIPKSGISQTHRKFLFAHYFTKIWNVALSRESGFAGREYRPETLVVFDEIHQVIDVPVVADLFVDIFKESRKFSVRFLFSLHGWSSLAKAGRGMESKIKQSIMDNGCNLIMLRGGRDAFESLQNFFGEMTVEDYDNLMNMDFCGLFAIRWQNKNHVFQARLLPPVDKKKNGKPELVQYDNWDLNDLAQYKSQYSREREEVRNENLKRVRSMLKKSIVESYEESALAEGVSWEDIKQDGMKEMK